MLANSSLPHIEVVPPSSGFNVTWSGLLMTIDVAAPGLIPFVEDKQRLLTGLVIQAGSLSQQANASYHVSLAMCLPW